METSFFVVSGTKQLYGYDLSLNRIEKKVIVKADDLFSALALASERLDLDYFVGTEADNEDLLNLNLEILE